MSGREENVPALVLAVCFLLSPCLQAIWMEVMWKLEVAMALHLAHLVHKEQSQIMELDCAIVPRATVLC